MNSMRLTSDDFTQMDSRYRATLANSLTGYKSANLVGTCNDAGVDNLAIMSSAVHLGSHPPLLAIVIRPDTAERHTLKNILHCGFFTLNHVSEPMIEQAHQTAARYSGDTSEFAATGLSVQREQGFPAPFVEESTIKLGLKFREHQTLSINDTNLVIAEIVIALLPEDCIADDGALNLNQAGTVTISGLDTYHRPQPLKRMSYAKPNLPPRNIAKYE